MDAVLTKTEESTDAQGRKVTTQTWESLTARPPTPANATNVRYSQSEGKHTLIFDIAGSSSETDYSVEGSMAQEPIETHEMFKDITDWEKWNKWKNNPYDESLNGWKPADGGDNMAKLGSLYEKGITDYLVPRAVLRITKEESGAPTLTNLGKITTPGSAPNLRGQANWMLTGVSGTKKTDTKWSNTYEYMSSGPAGWNSEIY